MAAGGFRHDDACNTRRRAGRHQMRVALLQPDPEVSIDFERARARFFR